MMILFDDSTLGFTEPIHNVFLKFQTLVSHFSSGFNTQPGTDWILTQSFSTLILSTMNFQMSLRWLVITAHNKKILLTNSQPSLLMTTKVPLADSLFFCNNKGSFSLLLP